MSSLRTKVLLAQVALAVLVSTFLGISSYFIMADLFLRTARANLEVIALEESLELSQRMEDHRKYFGEVAREEMLEFASPHFSAMGMVLHFAHFTDSFRTLSFADMEGQETIRLVDGKPAKLLNGYGRRPFFRRAVEQAGQIVTTDIQAGDDGRPVVNFAFALESHQGEELGVIVGEMPLDRISVIMLGYALGDMGWTVLVDSEGTILYHEDASLLMTPLTGLEGEPSALIGKIGKGERGFLRTVLLGTDAYVAHASVPGQDWTILTVLPYEQAMAGPRFLRNAVFAISLLITLFGSLLAMRWASSITRPLAELADLAGALAGGDFSRRADTSSGDEVGKLADAFNGMIDEIERSYADLTRQYEELKKIDRVKDALITDVTHELKTPVAKQGMHLEILRRALTSPGGDDRALEACRVMEDNVRRQQATIRNLLTISRLETGRREAVADSVDLRALADEAVDEFGDVFNALGITVKRERGDASVTSDREMLRLVCSNLIDNAVKYRREEKPEIAVGTGTAGNSAFFFVADNGIGMTAKEVERVFDRFYQVSSSAEGIGVGLSLSKMIVDRLGGTIVIESGGPMQGTRATVSLPPD